MSPSNQLFWCRQEVQDKRFIYVLREETLISREGISSPAARAASVSGGAPCLQQTEMQRRTLAPAFQAGTVYFCWKHNCLWLGFGNTFCPPNRQDGRMLAQWLDCPFWWPSGPARDTRRGYLEGGGDVFPQAGVLTWRKCARLSWGLISSIRTQLSQSLLIEQGEKESFESKS